MNKSSGDIELGYQWKARKIKPIILIYVGMIFFIFILISHFVFHSSEAVKALLITALGTIGPLSIAMFNRIEYKLTKEMLEHRPINQNKPSEFKTLFSLDQKINIKRAGSGLKYFLPLEESNPLKRFLKMNFSDKYSGEILIEKEDRKKVLDAFSELGISTDNSQQKRGE